jgi:alkylation response protein AidB-like acyl-CoA dehydrogenase
MRGMTPPSLSAIEPAPLTTFSQEWAALERRILDRAAVIDHSGGGLTEEVNWLRDAGWLANCLPSRAGGRGWGIELSAIPETIRALRLLGRANLSVARLFEGHMNAVKLVHLHGEGMQIRSAWALVRRGGILGVWGADTPGDPVRLRDASHGPILCGAKQFASGLGIVAEAVVSARDGEQTSLCLAPCLEPARMDTSSWNVAGMRATASGTYDFDNVDIAGRLLGKPEDYYIEPHFEGGVWRYCAAHLGGAEALYIALRDALTAMNRAEDPHQQRRLVESAIAVEGARLWIARAALAVERPGAPPRTATLSLLCREATEAACRSVLIHVEQALGMQAHQAGSAVERVRRDLGLFLCQAQPDAKRARAATALAAATDLPETL